MDAATLERETRQTHLALLRAQLNNIDSMKQTVDSQVVELDTGGLEDSVDELRLVSLDLADTHAALREIFDSLARPLLRPLKIQDLPDELLMHIFGYLRNRAEIKNLRLSCQRLNKTSSHLLMDTIHVSPNPKSLKRLGEVSRHPNISRGIRRLVASVDVYSADFAHDVESFAVRCVHESNDLIQNLGENIFRRLDVLVMQSGWAEFAERSTDTYNDEAYLNEADNNDLYNGWLRYHKLYHEQQMVLRRGRFPLAIASAIGRMPCLEDLVIRDRSRSSDGEQPWGPSTLQKLANLTQDPTRLVEEMMLHTFSWQRARIMGVENPPTQLLYQIPLEIQAARHSVAHLKFDLSPPHSFQLQLSSIEMARLVYFARGLKSFTFSTTAEPVDFWRPSRDAEEHENLVRFLTPFLKSKNLDSVALDFAFEERDCLAENRTHDPDRTSIRPILANLHQPQSIHLKNCSITLEELRNFVRFPRQEPAVLGLWYVYLLDGDWADAVELLRSEVLRGGLSQDSVSNLVILFPFSLRTRHPIFALIPLFVFKVLWLWSTCYTSDRHIGPQPSSFSPLHFFFGMSADFQRIVCEKPVRSRVLDHVDGRKEQDLSLQV